MTDATGSNDEHGSDRGFATMSVQEKSSECPSGDTLVIRIPFPTTANGVPWKDTAWIEYVTKAALNAGSAYAVGCGAIFDNVNISIDKGQPPTTKGFYVDPQTNLAYQGIIDLLTDQTRRGFLCRHCARLQGDEYDEW